MEPAHCDGMRASSSAAPAPSRLTWVALVLSAALPLACGGAPFVTDFDAGGGTPSSDGGGATGSDSGARADASGAPTLACGASSCARPREVCCVTSNGGTFDFTCRAGGCGGGGGGGPVALGCSASTDCPGEACCFDSNTNVAACAPACPGGTILCLPGATPSGCPQGTTCSGGQIETLPASYGACQ